MAEITSRMPAKSVALVQVYERIVPSLHVVSPRLAREYASGAVCVRIWRSGTVCRPLLQTIRTIVTWQTESPWSWVVVFTSEVLEIIPGMFRGGTPAENGRVIHFKLLSSLSAVGMLRVES